MKTTAGKENATTSQSSQPFFSKKGGNHFLSSNEMKQPFFLPPPLLQKSPDHSLLGNDVSHAPFSRPNAVVQTKLTINEPGDPYEQEADAMADRVMRMSAPTSGESEEEDLIQTKELPISAVQRKCADCEQEEKVQRQEIEEEEPLQTTRLMRKSTGGGNTASPKLSSQLNSSKSGGNPLPVKTLDSMNRAFGADFSKVRIHTGSRAEEMSQGIQAKAFTHGANIYFNQGQYNPETSEGKRLLGHELTHVVQQGAAKNGSEPAIQRAMKFELQTRNVVWRTKGKKKSELPRKFGPTKNPNFSRFLHKGTHGKPAVEKDTWVEVKGKKRKPSEYLWTYQVILSPKGNVDFFGKKAIVKPLKSKVQNPDAKGVKFNPNTYESRFYSENNKELFVRLNKSGDKFERLSLVRHPYQMIQVTESKEGTAIELQSEAHGYVEFEMASWHSGWCAIKKRIQEAVDMVDKINKSKVITNTGGVKTVEFPFDIKHLKRTKDFKEGLTAGESLEVQILDPTWDAKIQASESFELSQFGSYLKEHLPADFASITGSAKNILQSVNTKKIPDKDLVNLFNFIQIIIEHLKEAHKWKLGKQNLAKENISLMSRTNFSSIYQTLLSKGVEQQLFKEIVKSNAIPKELGLKPKDLIFPKGFVGYKSPGPKIREWLISIYTQKRDLLSSLGGDNRAMGRFDVDTAKGEEHTDLVKFEARRTVGYKQNRPVVDQKSTKGVVKLGGWVAFAEEVFKAASKNRPRTGSTKLVYNPKKC